MSRRFDRDTQDGTPFVRIFAAVLLALIAYGLLEYLVVSRIQKMELEKFQRSISAELSKQQSTSRDTPSPTYYAPESTQYPSLPGPIQAKRAGQWKACVNRRVTLYINGGWDQTSAPCNAYSD